MIMQINLKKDCRKSYGFYVQYTVCTRQRQINGLKNVVDLEELLDDILKRFHCIAEDVCFIYLSVCFNIISALAGALIILL